MDTSLSWIKAYVPELDVTAQEYTDAMTLSGKCRNRDRTDCYRCSERKRRRQGTGCSGWRTRCGRT